MPAARQRAYASGVNRSARWTEDDVSRVERRLGVRLPAAFRRYLLLDGSLVLGADAMLSAFSFMSAEGDRQLGRPL